MAARAANSKRTRMRRCCSTGRACATACRCASKAWWTPSAMSKPTLRPRGSQLGAWASKQSETLDSRATFEQRLAKAESDFDGREVPRPPRWSGLRVKPERIEFWFGAEFRIHERWLYERNRAGGWTKRMLYP